MNTYIYTFSLNIHISKHNSFRMAYNRHGSIVKHNYDIYYFLLYDILYCFTAYAIESNSTVHSYINKMKFICALVLWWWLGKSSALRSLKTRMRLGKERSESKAHTFQSLIINLDIIWKSQLTTKNGEFLPIVRLPVSRG